MTLLAAELGLLDLKLDFYLGPLPSLTVFKSALSAQFEASAAACRDSGKAAHVYSANQLAALGGLKRIYLGSVIAVYAISDV